jgi:hypothetical protein
MRTCTLSVVHDGCWASESCKSHENIRLNIMTFRMKRHSYDLWCSITQKNGQLLSPPDEEAVRHFIRKHPSIEGWTPVLEKEHLGSPKAQMQKGVYKATVNDMGFSQGVVRILSRVKGVKLHPLTIMPVTSETLDGQQTYGIEKINFFTEDEETFQNAKQALKQDTNIHVLDDLCESKGTNLDNMFHDHPNCFETFIHMDKEDYNYVAKALGFKGGSELKYLSEDTNFIDIMKRNGPLFYKLVEIICSVGALKELYDLVEIMSRVVH